MCGMWGKCGIHLVVLWYVSCVGQMWHAFMCIVVCVWAKCGTHLVVIWYVWCVGLYALSDVVVCVICGRVLCAFCRLVMCVVYERLC